MSLVKKGSYWIQDDELKGHSNFYFENLLLLFLVKINLIIYQQKFNNRNQDFEPPLMSYEVILHSQYQKLIPVPSFLPQKMASDSITCSTLSILTLKENEKKFENKRRLSWLINQVFLNESSQHKLNFAEGFKSSDNQTFLMMQKISLY